jgi:hypothetical protein
LDAPFVCPEWFRAVPELHASPETETFHHPRPPQLQVRKEYVMRTKRLTTQQRQEIFHTLVTTQDMVPNVRKSYELVTGKYEISDTQLREIEDEGLDKQWPPLAEAVQEVS